MTLSPPKKRFHPKRHHLPLSNRETNGKVFCYAPREYSLQFSNRDDQIHNLVLVLTISKCPNIIPIDWFIVSNKRRTVRCSLLLPSSKFLSTLLQYLTFQNIFLHSLAISLDLYKSQTTHTLRVL